MTSRVVMLASFVLCALVSYGTTPASYHAATPIRFVLSEETVLSGVRPFGINITDDAWYSGNHLTAERIHHGGFEGVLYRHITWGPPAGNASSMWDWFQPGQWGGLLPGMEYRVLTGAAAGRMGDLQSIRLSPFSGRPELGAIPLYDLSNTTASDHSLGENDAVLLTRRLLSGFIGQHGGAWWVFTEGDGQVRTAEAEPLYSSTTATPNMAAVLQASAGFAAIMGPLGHPDFATLQGRWRIQFRAKGKGELLCSLGNFARREENGYASAAVPLSSTWTTQELSLEVSEPVEAFLGLRFAIRQGEVWIDDISCRHEHETSPTGFSQQAISALQRLQPGVLRWLQLGGSSLENILVQPHARWAYASSRTQAPHLPDTPWPSHPQEGGSATVHTFALYDFLRLCAIIGADPWICVPGTLTAEEMQGLIAFLAAPATVDSPWALRRLALGRKTPWTAQFRRIHLEIGNEAWNEIPPFLHAGYSLSGTYWDALFAAAKASPYYTANIRLVAGGQAVNSQRNARIVRETPHADVLAIAPYLLHGLPAKAADWNDTQLLDYLFASAFLAKDTWMTANAQDAFTRMEPAVYEVNHHITGGDAPALVKNRLAASLAGGVNVAHWMCLLLRDFSIRTQCFFTLAQFQQPTALGDVRLWGAAASLKPGQERLRPTFLALELVNRAVRGDLVAARARDGIPHHLVTMADDGHPRDVSIPAVAVFPFRHENGGWSCLLFNLETAGQREIRLATPHPPKEGQLYLLQGDSPFATNEPEGPEQVTIVERRPAINADGFAIILPASSMALLTWPAATPTVLKESVP